MNANGMVVRQKKLVFTMPTMTTTTTTTTVRHTYQTLYRHAHDHDTYFHMYACLFAFVYIHVFDTIQTADRAHSMCQSTKEWRGADNGARCILNILYYIVYAVKRINTIGSTATESGCRCSYVPCVKRPIVIIVKARESMCVKKTLEYVLKKNALVCA